MRILLLLCAISISMFEARALNQPFTGDSAELPMANNPKAKLLQKVAFEQKLNTQIPLSLSFNDEKGDTVRLEKYFRNNRPVILVPAYYTCPNLCTLVLNGVTDVLRDIPFSMSKDYEVVTVSIDPQDNPQLAALKKQNYLRLLGKKAYPEGWHFLTGESPSIASLMQSIGFQYAYDAELKQYVHASGILVLTPEAKIARYFYGIQYSPRDLRLGLVEASKGRIGSPVDQLLLTCYHYDPSTGKYGLIILKTLRLAGVSTVGAMAASFFVLQRRRRYVEKRRKEDAARS